MSELCNILQRETGSLEPPHELEYGGKRTRKMGSRINGNAFSACGCRLFQSIRVFDLGNSRHDLVIS